MSKDITVLMPNGRRQKVHCTPDTIILQVLEDVCARQGFQPTEYALKHHNHILDLTISVRYSNLPNKATLEMVESDRKIEETNVTIGLLLEDGERRTAEFPPQTSLLDLVTMLAPSELKSLQQPTILYMRQEVIGIHALKEKTLRQLGLLGGRAILRLLNKAEEAKQANVSSVYRRPETAESPEAKHVKTESDDTQRAGPSNPQTQVKQFDPVKLIKDVKKQAGGGINIQPTSDNHQKEITKINQSNVQNKPAEKVNCEPPKSSESALSFMTQEHLERRLKIEEEVTFLGGQKAVAFTQPDLPEDHMNDLPDDFYELSIEEVRKLYKDLQQRRMELEDSPLVSSSKREAMEKQTSEQRLASYKNVVVRVQFPDRIILQGIFAPSNKIGDIIKFIKEHLREPNRPFDIFTTPIKETLDHEMTLLEAKFVPCVHMHFKWLDDNGSHRYLKDEIYRKQTSSDAASLLASKYRAPTRRKLENSGPETSQKPTAGSSSTAKKSKIPSWFKK